jgi:hypothetical protein
VTTTLTDEEMIEVQIQGVINAATVTRATTMIVIEGNAKGTEATTLKMTVGTNGDHGVKVKNVPRRRSKCTHLPISYGRANNVINLENADICYLYFVDVEKGLENVKNAKQKRKDKRKRTKLGN